MDQIAEVLQPVNVQIAGVAVEVKPIVVDKIQRLMPHLRAVLAVWNDMGEVQAAMPYLTLIERACDDLAHAVGITTDRPVEWVMDLQVMDLVDLATSIVEANPDFMAQLFREVPVRVAMAAP